MYQCFSPTTGRRVDTDFYGEACLYHSFGYIVFDWSMLESRCRVTGATRAVRNTQGA